MSLIRITAVLLACLLLAPDDASAIGRRGGGGPRPSMGGGGGRARPNVSVPRPAARPAARPNFNRPSPSRPAAPRPNLNRPAPRPGGGINPARPTTRPSVRPGLGTPSINRPANRPAQPNRPAVRPGNALPGGGRPNLGGARPGVNPPAGGVRPSRPSLPARPGGDTRPSTRPGVTRPATRPTPGGVGDFLGLDKPLRPGAGRPTTLPGAVARPGGGLADRPGTRPGIATRPGAGSRPKRPANRPDFGDRWGNNNVINKRPAWVNIDNRTNVNVQKRWGAAIGRPGWQSPGPARRGYWNGWGNGVRHGWSHYHHCGRWFNGSWWGRHPHGLCGWHYHYANHNRRWRYWWTVPTWGAFNGWFAWSAPAEVWSEPVYYDYGSGGNVTYQDNSVFIGGAEVATAEEFAQSAMALATVEPPESEEAAAESEWMSLGTFAVSSDERDTDPDLTVQLAVNREGVVAGTLYNPETDEASSVQGAVDRETQRVAVRFGESEEVVAETGLYNLTQEEAPVLIHFGAEKTANYLLVRLDPPEEESSNETAP